VGLFYNAPEPTWGDRQIDRHYPRANAVLMHSNGQVITRDDDR